MRTARIAPPWYVHPAAAPRDWAWLATQRRTLSFAVVNVHNGPGGDDDAYYPTALAGLPGIRLVGYVPVDYGRRPPADVVRDIDAWQRLYGIDAIMLDEVPSAPESLARCARYAAAARAAGVTFLVANPGVFPSPAHLDLFDVTAVFEGTAATYAEFEHPAWARHVAPSRLWHLVYGCSPAQIPALRRDALGRGAGHVFTTDRSLPNPWLGPPSAVSARAHPGGA
ncbi:spherulation-specific family 4 protein [Arthrobacter antioxidans]|uniref:spherulation-specific family 4 protein n=1 Tax=Arthrobacter antioxidans TaxID=2895818 RepID=UPI001FFF880B|nr:spherulation-specific family 4 protein [Arthrobacter antioxidans]